MKATATRLPSLASNVLKLKEEVLNPKPDANGWCLGRESVEKALEEMRNGRPVVVTDDGDRENEGDLIFAAETVSQQTMAFVVRHTSGGRQARPLHRYVRRGLGQAETRTDGVEERRSEGHGLCGHCRP